MASNRQRNSPDAPQPEKLPAGNPEPTEEDIDLALEEHVYHLLENRPDLMSDLFEDVTSLVEEFVKEHGREPTGDELADMVLGDISDEELMELEEDAEELEWTLGLSRELDEWGVDEDEDPIVVSQHCAGCLLPIGEDTPCLTIGAKLAVLPFRQSQEAAVFYLPLMEQNRLVAGILVPPHSPAKAEGWDVVFPICCEECGKELRQSLAASVATHLRDLQN